MIGVTEARRDALAFGGGLRGPPNPSWCRRREFCGRWKSPITPIDFLERLFRRIDEAQRRRKALAIPFAVNKKFGDDNCGSLAAQLTYYGFLTFFPLLLVLVTVLGIVAGGNSTFGHRVLHSALAQFPVIGNTSGPLSLANNIHGLRKNGIAGVTIGLLGLLWGAMGSVQSGQHAMAQVWNVPQIDRPGFGPRTLRSLGTLAMAALFLALSISLSVFATFGDGHPALLRAVGLIGSFVVDVALMNGIFRILTPKVIGTRGLLLGATLAGLAYGALQVGGTLLVDHELRHMSQVYGLFAIVLGTLWWIYLLSRVVLYAAEANVVLSRQLWPRGLLVPPLTPADIEMLQTYPRQEVRRPEVAIMATLEERRALDDAGDARPYTG